MANKMAEETPQQITQVTTKDLKKVVQGRRLAEYNCKKREELKAQGTIRKIRRHRRVVNKSRRAQYPQHNVMALELS